MKIKLTRTVIQKTRLFAYLIFMCSSVFAQDQEVSKLKIYETAVPQKLFLPPFSTEMKLFSLEDSIFRNDFSPTSKNFFRLKESNSFKRISFKQTKTENNLPGLGSYVFFNNNMSYTIGNKAEIELGVGLAQQNSTLSAAKPNYQIGFQASVEFAITSKLDAFIYGQYFTSPVNKPKDFFDPMIYRNPLFLQSEIGAGLKRNYKNVNAKFQINSIYDNTVRQFAPVNSKISIGF